MDLSGGATTLSSADVLMSDWALKSTWGPSGTSTGFMVPLTLNIYNVGAGDSGGSLIGSVATNAFIQWRPEASGSTGTLRLDLRFGRSGAPLGWTAGAGRCVHRAAAACFQPYLR